MKTETTVTIPECDINENIALEKYRINPLADISEPPVYCYIGSAPAMTAGNFSLINGKAKSGKTFFLGSIVASFISNSTQLGVIRGCLPEDKHIILYFDTEQSSFHATRTIQRICKMAGTADPDNLIAYGLRPLTPADRVAAIEDKISTTENLGAVFIDGIRDLLTMGINDEAEATTLTSKFLKWTAEYNIHIVLLLHQNKTDLNARGHIGTEVLNKAETTLTIAKKEKTDIFAVSCDYSRDIGFEDFGFIIHDGLPEGADLPQEGQVKGKDPKKINDEEHIEKLTSIFNESRKLGIKDLNGAIQYHFTVGENRARDFIYHYELKQWLHKIREGKFVFYEYTRAIF